jgi:hypothetical protein
MIHPPRQRRSAGRFECGSSCLLLSGDENTSESEEQELEQLNASKNEMTTKPADEKSKLKLVPRGVFEVVTSFLTILFTGFGAAFTLGILLNLNGYGYRFSLQEGVRIDTLDEMRMERQLNQVSTPPSDVSESTKPSPVAAVGDFLTRQPFTATLLLTGVVLIYEEAVAKPSKESDDESSDKSR